jgi:type II secretory pathway pseudopilin PulG
MKNKKAFTLIEILVVVGALMLIIVSVSGIMSAVFNSQNKNKAIDKITQNGGWILSELKKNILSAKTSGQNGDGFNCSMSPTVGNSIEIISGKDGERTTIKCLDDNGDGYKIASISGTSVGTTVYLFQKNQDLELVNCDNFVSCSTLPSLQLSNVSFNFSLKAGNDVLSSGTTKVFLMDASLRN